MLESHHLGQTYVSAEHFWLAILRAGDCKAGVALRRLGVDSGKARVELIRQLRQ